MIRTENNGKEITNFINFFSENGGVVQLVYGGLFSRNDDDTYKNVAVFSTFIKRDV